MILNLGDVQASSTLYIPFHTFDSNDPSASVTLTGLAVTDIEIYKDGSVTQRSSDAGYTLLDTDGIDFDGVTGLHGFSVDLSDNTDAGFYAAGSTYWVAVSSVTVDAATINFWAAVFTIERAGGPATILTDTEAVLTDSEAILTDSEAIIADTELVLTDTEAVLTDTETGITERATLLTDTEAVLVDSEAIISDTELVLTDAEAILTDSEAILADTEARGLTALATGTAQSGTASTIVLASASSFADNELNGNVINIVGGTGVGQSRVISSNTLADDTVNVVPNWTTNPDATSTYEIVQGSVNVDTVVLTTQTAGDIIADTEALLVDTEAVLVDSEAILVDSEAIISDTELVLTDTEAIITDTETGITERATLLTDTEAVLTDSEAILTDSEAVLTDSEAILADTGTDGVKLNATQPSGWADNLVKSAGQIVQGTVDTVTNGHTPTTTEFQADDITEATTDHFKGRIVIFTSGALANQATDITAYSAVGGIGQLTVTALTEAPVNDMTFIIV